MFISGQTAWDANGHLVGERDLAGQVQQALRNVKVAVEAAGGNLSDVVALRICIVQGAMHDVGVIGVARNEWFPVEPPTSSWLGVSSLARPAFLVEVEAVAVLATAWSDRVASGWTNHCRKGRHKACEWRRMSHMSIEELEAAALRLEPKARARLAGRLLESLDDLSPAENAHLWAEEAQRRAAALDAGALGSRPAEDVFRDAQARI